MYLANLPVPQQPLLLAAAAVEVTQLLVQQNMLFLN